jgi:hypothetical protein
MIEFNFYILPAYNKIGYTANQSKELSDRQHRIEAGRTNFLHFFRTYPHFSNFFRGNFSNNHLLKNG